MAVDGALEWAEKKAEQLGEETDDTGPYASPATCAPTDLDPIASGVLPAMPAPGCEDKEEVVRDVEERVASPGSRERSGKL